MNFKLRLLIFWLILGGLVLAVFATGCEPYRSLTFENQTSRPVQVDGRVVPLDYTGVPSFTWDDRYKEAIDAGQSKKLVTAVRIDRTVTFKYAVIAVNQDNEVVFSKVYTWDELHDMNWIVVIKAQQ